MMVALTVDVLRKVRCGSNHQRVACPLHMPTSSDQHHSVQSTTMACSRPCKRCLYTNCN